MYMVSKKNVCCIIQARTTSTRLPNKVFKNLAGYSMLYHVIERVKRTHFIDKIIIATTNKIEDDEIEKFCIENSIEYFRGDKENVLKRYYDAAKYYNADVIVRVTSDCPMIEPTIIDYLVKYFLDNNYDYVSPGSPEGIIRGLDTEVFSINALNRAYDLAEKKEEKEHVTWIMYNKSDFFKVGRPNVEEVFKNENIRICVDELEDYKLMEIIYNLFYIENEIVNTRDVIEFLNKNNEICKINKNIKQKIK